MEYIANENRPADRTLPLAPAVTVLLWLWTRFLEIR